MSWWWVSKGQTSHNQSHLTTSTHHPTSTHSIHPLILLINFSTISHPPSFQHLFYPSTTSSTIPPPLPPFHHLFHLSHRQHYPGSKSDRKADSLGKKFWSSEDYSSPNGLNGGGCWARVRGGLSVEWGK